MVGVALFSEKKRRVTFFLSGVSPQGTIRTFCGVEWGDGNYEKKIGIRY